MPAGHFLESSVEGGNPSLTEVSHSPPGCPEVWGKHRLLPFCLHAGCRVHRLSFCCHFCCLSLPWESSFLSLSMDRRPDALQESSRPSAPRPGKPSVFLTDHSVQNAHSHCWCSQLVSQYKKSLLIIYYIHPIDSAPLRTLTQAHTKIILLYELKN